MFSAIKFVIFLYKFWF